MGQVGLFGLDLVLFLEALLKKLLSKQLCDVRFVVLKAFENFFPWCFPNLSESSFSLDQSKNLSSSKELTLYYTILTFNKPKEEDF